MELPSFCILLGLIFPHHIQSLFPRVNEYADGDDDNSPFSLLAHSKQLQIQKETKIMLHDFVKKHIIFESASFSCFCRDNILYLPIYKERK